MKFPITLLLVYVLFSQAQSLVCHLFVCQGGSTQCKSTEIKCPDRCATVTLFTLKDGINSTSILKTCAIPELCVTESVNLGEIAITSNAKCCNTTLCNSETLPVLPQQRANGKICYSCKNNDCSQTVDCAVNEDYCISQKVNYQGKSLTMKGCASKSNCAASKLLTLQGIGTVSNQCCQGNLCNSAKSFTLSFLLMIISGVSSIIYY